MFTLPTVITFTRIFAIPVLLLIIYGPFEMIETTKNILATIVFVIASLTDWLDGWLARRLNQISSFGAFLDPVADKLMVCTVLIILVDLERVDAVIGIIIVGREIAVSALRPPSPTSTIGLSTSWRGLKIFRVRRFPKGSPGNGRVSPNISMRLRRCRARWTWQRTSLTAQYVPM